MPDRTRTAPDWEDVRFFLALARHGSLSAAARALKVNHATVARRVAGLEASLGAALLERRPAGYELTGFGRLALQAAGGMEDAAGRMPRAGASPTLAGVLRITAPPALAAVVLLPWLAEFQARYPGLDVELVAELRPLSLLRHETDLALRYGSPPDGELVARRLPAVHFGFYAAPAWRERLAAGHAPAFIGFDAGNRMLPEAAWLSAQFPEARVVVRVNGHIAQAAAARAGCGVALLPRFVGDGEPALVSLDLPARPPARSLFLLSRRDFRQVPRIGLARAFLAHAFEQERGRFDGPAQFPAS